MKLVSAGQSAIGQASPPTRGRGLKPHDWPLMTRANLVAPHAGAWIETALLQCNNVDLYRRPPRGGVD